MTEIGDAARPVRILLVDDSPGDVSLTEEALLAGRVANQLHVVEDGEQAIDFMRRRGKYADAPVPDLVLLDLNLPRMDGREVLRELKGDDNLRHVPVIVLTTSADERDVLTSYRLHANAYVTKPVEFGEFLLALHQLESFWLQIVRLPTGPAAAPALPRSR
ncbi:MAG: response regulator [Frankiaceae bacterium]|nr:response regulator [Frankiaceae bacterium]MBV9369258.1 response regulator [Frankiales bacterium]